MLVALLLQTTHLETPLLVNCIQKHKSFCGVLNRLLVALQLEARHGVVVLTGDHGLDHCGAVVVVSEFRVVCILKEEGSLSVKRVGSSQVVVREGALCHLPLLVGCLDLLKRVGLVELLLGQVSEVGLVDEAVYPGSVSEPEDGRGGGGLGGVV